MLSLVELSRAARVLGARIAGHRIQQILQPDASRLVLSTYGAAPQRRERGHHVLLSCRPETARLSLLARAPRALPVPPAFTQYLRAHLAGAAISGVSLVGEDRLAALDLETQEGAARLLLSILGRRSNLYLLDAEDRLLAALRPLEATRPELALGEPWRAPASRPPRAGEDRFADEPDTRLLEAIEESYGAAEAEGAHAELRRRVEQALRREQRRLDRKLEKLGSELEAARAATGLARQGELLKGALSRVRRGDTEVTVHDHETGEEVGIRLDPTRSPAENLDHLFKRYRKALRGLSKGGAQEEAVRGARRELEALWEEFQGVAEGQEALRAFAGRPEVRKLIGKVAPAGPAGPARAPQPRSLRLGRYSVPRRLLPRRYRTAGGLEIWVGRSDEANDFLTTRLAHGRDLFFHLEGAPGSHVVLRTGGRADPPSEALLDACELAVQFSRFSKASRADVRIVPIKNVRKPKGAKPGLVTVHGGRTLHLRRTPARLRRVLAARIED